MRSSRCRGVGMIEDKETNRARPIPPPPPFSPPPTSATERTPRRTVAKDGKRDAGRQVIGARPGEAQADDVGHQVAFLAVQGATFGAFLEQMATPGAPPHTHAVNSAYIKGRGMKKNMSGSVCAMCTCVLVRTLEEINRLVAANGAANHQWDRVGRLERFPLLRPGRLEVHKESHLRQEKEEDESTNDGEADRSASIAVSALTSTFLPRLPHTFPGAGIHRGCPYPLFIVGDADVRPVLARERDWCDHDKRFRVNVDLDLALVETKGKLDACPVVHLLKGGSNERRRQKH